MNDHDDIVQRLLDWFGEHARDLPWRRTRDPYAIWVSEVMLQQTQVKTVLPYWQRWMRALPSLRQLAEADSQKLHKLWEGLGYYTRVRNLQKAARRILEVHGGQFPTRFADILALPGIGPYTAGAICSIAFDQPTAILDGNVIRVLTRLFGIRGNPRGSRTNEFLWKLAADLVAAASALKNPGRRSRFGHWRPCSQLNQSLMELGAVLCTPRKPVCSDCPVRRDCVARLRGLTERLPALPKRPRTIARRYWVVVARGKDRYWAMQRPAGVVNGHLWEFPAFEVCGPSDTLSHAVRKLFQKAPRRLEPLCRLKHSITRYRITTEVILADGGELRSGPGQWLSLDELKHLPFSSAHKRILGRLAAA